jgi:hypothetical protein
VAMSSQPRKRLKSLVYSADTASNDKHTCSMRSHGPSCITGCFQWPESHLSDIKTSDGGTAKYKNLLQLFSKGLVFVLALCLITRTPVAARCTTKWPNGKRFQFQFIDVCCVKSCVGIVRFAQHRKAVSTHYTGYCAFSIVLSMIEVCLAEKFNEVIEKGVMLVNACDILPLARRMLLAGFP